jgi:pimeloyl-ACP methyl ester carboxylesterase
MEGVARGVAASRTITLRDGRRLGYLDYGDPQGRPIFLFHGFNGSRLDRHPDDVLTASLGVRIIAADRPGIGLSSPQRKRRVVDWPNDVAELADRLGIAKFAVLGYSWGGPYALACAHHLPERVAAVGLVAPMTGWLVGRDRTGELSPGFRRLSPVVRYAPALMLLAFAYDRRRRFRNPDRTLDAVLAQWLPCDLEVVRRLGMRQLLLDNLTEAWRQGAAGVHHDVLTVARPWGFRPSEVATEIMLWQGEADRLIKPYMARSLADTLQHCRATYYPAEGHLILFDHWAEILGALRDAG